MATITVSLLKNQESSIEVPFVTSLRELPFKNKVNFDVCYFNLVEAKNDKDFSIYDYCEHLAKCISAYSGVDLNKFLDLTIGSSYEDLQFCFDTLVDLFKNIVDIINQYSYNGLGNVFEYKGIEFTIPQKQLDLVLNLDKYDKVSLGQFIKINSIKKVLSELDDSYKTDGSTIYSDTLSTLAVLAESENYKFDNSTEYVEAMLKFFDDIDTQTAMDVSFFLLISWSTLPTIRNYSIFSSHLKTSVKRHLKKLKKLNL